MRENKKTIIMTCLVCLLPILLGIVLYDRLPEQMPIHWNAAGEIDGYGSKAMAVFGMPLFMLVIQFIVYVAVLSDPKKQNQSKIMRCIGFWTIPLINLILYPMTIFAGLGYNVPMDRIVMLFVGVIFILCGNYLPKTRQNYTIGIKLPWTLHDQDNWNKTHRLAGFLWVIGGLIFMAAAFVPAIGMFFILPVILIMVLIPLGYSFYLYQKKGKDRE